MVNVVRVVRLHDSMVHETMNTTGHAHLKHLCALQFCESLYLPAALCDLHSEYVLIIFIIPAAPLVIRSDYIEHFTFTSSLLRPTRANINQGRS